MNVEVKGPAGPARSRARGARAGRGLLCLLAGAMLVLVAACGGGDSGGDSKEKAGAKVSGGGGGGSEGKKASQAVVTIAPKDGANGVATEGALKVTASKGRLVSVKVADDEGNKVEGAISGDGSSWVPAAHLGIQTKYTVDAVAKDKDGLESAKHARFTTVVPANTYVGYFTPEDGSTVGVGMPVSINFNRPITNREAVEKAIKVTAEPGVDVEGHWFGNQRLDFRPQTYWVAGTKVTLGMRLNGVQAAPGVYGKQSKDVHFTIGRSQVSTVDAKSKQMVVKRDGRVVKNIPITSGGPGHTTYNGQMVISEKLNVTRMNGATVGFKDSDGKGEYDIKDVPHAMRLTTSGTFIHGNYWLPQSSFGQINGSHGCVGLFDLRGAKSTTTPGGWFFKESMIGDVVVVRNSQDRTVQPDNGLNGWNMAWSEWSAPQK